MGLAQREAWTDGTGPVMVSRLWNLSPWCGGLENASHGRVDGDVGHGEERGREGEERVLIDGSVLYVVLIFSVTRSY
jgi:hypothetical protein